MKKNFSLAAVLTILSGKFTTKEGYEGAHNLLKHLTSEYKFECLTPVYDAKSYSEVIFEQHPALRKLDANLTGVTEKNFGSWLKKQEAIYGKELAFTPISNA